MLSRTRISKIISLNRKKTRDEEKLFIIEGDKIVKEFLNSDREIRTLLAKPEFISGISPDRAATIDEIIPVSFEELRKVSSLKTPHNAMAVVRMPELNFDEREIMSGLCAALDFIQDPGNLGTIIRAAAWFGIKEIVCSENCVDVYNPKVIQSTMGAILNVNVHYTDMGGFLGQANETGVSVFGTLLDGEPVYTAPLDEKGIIVIGNESRGISDDLLPFITRKIKIPKFTPAKTGIDSLNAGMAASIVFSEFARRRAE